MPEKSATLNELGDMLAECDLFREFDYAEISLAAHYFNFIEIEKGSHLVRAPYAVVSKCRHVEKGLTAAFTIPFVHGTRRRPCPAARRARGPPAERKYNIVEMGLQTKFHRDERRIK